MNKKYFDYFKYILEHKKNVFNECIKLSKKHKGKIKRDLIIHAITHDLSKFSPKEFIAYAEYDFKNKENNTSKIETDFDKAWRHHKDKNKHHWNYWYERNLEMPKKYILQMICDWSAMSVKFGDNPQSFYFENYNSIKLHQHSRFLLELFLGLLDFDFQINDEWYHCRFTIKDIYNDCMRYKENHPNSYSDCFKIDFVEFYKRKFGIKEKIIMSAMSGIH